ncbi:MAG: sulfotransferase [Alphaproteobacteria bacterium]|nr:sulfotransferase [Alphaproteobacteria bacterium]MBV9372532.1 sulfotransferase [Alphaproteobacteria bacterium]MBV9902239.1 sulfotransferase [Alphaproteobacteria bacterium]
MTGHLIHIGYPKTGSNFLRRWFTEHPEVAFSHGGIAGYPNVYAIAGQAATPSEGVKWRVTSAESLTTPHAGIDEGDPDYQRLRRRPLPEAQARVCETLGAVFPGASILLVTRGFRSMLISAYSQYARTGGELTLDAFCRPDPVPGAAPANAWDYDRLIGLYERTFGAERLIVLPYELLRDDPQGFVEAVAGPLGLEPRAPAQARVNPSLSPAALAWYPRLNRLARRLPSGRLRSLYRRAAREGRLDGLAGLLQRLRPRPVPLEAGLGEDLLAPFEGRATKLASRPAYAPYLSDYLLPEAPGS